VVFSLDRQGVQLPLPFESLRDIDADLDVEDLGLLSNDELPSQLGSRLSSLLGEKVHDEDGIYDLVACINGQPVATLVLSAGPNDDFVNLAGSRLPSLSNNVLVDAVRLWLTQS
jgi:hypothetical protein